MEKLEPLAVGTSEAAQLLNISRPTLYKLMKNPEFPKFKIRTRTVIPMEELRIWVKDQSIRSE